MEKTFKRGRNFMMTLSRQNLANGFTYLALFLLPWQTRWIFARLNLGGEPWEYGVLSLYAVEILIFCAVLLRGRFHWPLKMHSLIFPGGIFFGLSFIFSFFSLVPILSFVTFFHTFFAFLLFLLLLDERLSFFTSLTYFFCGLLVPVCLGWFQVLTGTSPASTFFGLAEHMATTLGVSVIETSAGRLMRAYGSFSHPNIFGGFLAVAVFFASIFPIVFQKKKTIWFVLAAFLSSTTLIVTFSRSAWVAIVVSLILFFLFVWFERKESKRFHRSFGVMSFVLIGGCIALFGFRDAVMTRFNSTVRLEVKSVSDRVFEYGDFQTLYSSLHPMQWFYGIGSGTYTVALEQLNPGYSVWNYQPIPNTVFLFLNENGWILFLIATVWLGMYLNYFFKYRVQGGIIGIIFCVLYGTIALFDHYLWSSWSGMVLIAVSVGFSLRFVQEKEKENSG